MANETQEQKRKSLRKYLSSDQGPTTEEKVFVFDDLPEDNGNEPENVEEDKRTESETPPTKPQKKTRTQQPAPEESPENPTTTFPARIIATRGTLEKLRTLSEKTGIPIGKLCGQALELAISDWEAEHGKLRETVRKPDLGEKVFRKK